ncbi:uncharacterized protein CANTADRAFT_23045 [Suhomyces tanzawaensis NRRL Y-17324]|uniref:MICOS complex subunit n=1 Tax=Suhomyces tanzawaensis NRRL Y-17324 TaxID=984487 RepID=A0A1E4SEK8_9ASCO|nr:uncharacterized protein CANTADRAFT_23045 [Suhomyces tanzawaensis NRRL Y-17324]ODV77928.1 hypothetical protein CANTADRAFT_23045 [Suhomyces tanzawaensis NRRL Y-17324]
MARSFYEDDELVINKPGYNVEISLELKEQESLHGPISFIQGMGIRSTPYLESWVNKARLFVHSKAAIYEAELGTQKSAFLNEVDTLKSEVKATIKEPVLPGLIYILTATLTGSILVGRKSLPLRFVSPVVFASVSTSYFMPNTWESLTNKYLHFEHQKAPELTEKRHQVVSAYQSTKQDVDRGVQSAKAELQRGVRLARLWLDEISK